MGRPKGSKNKNKEENETVPESKFAETAVVRNVPVTEVIQNADGKKEEKREEVLKPEGFHYGDKTKDNLQVLTVGQAWFRDNDGRLYIGQDSRNEIFVERIGCWVNRLRNGDWVVYGDWCKQD